MYEKMKENIHKLITVLLGSKSEQKEVRCVWDLEKEG